MLVDGFRAAHLLGLSKPACYAILSSLKIPSHASGGSDTLVRPLMSKPVFEHNDRGELNVIRWNSDDRDVIGQGQSWEGECTLDDGRRVGKVEGFYEAVKEWERILRSADSQYWFQLKAGTPVSKCHSSHLSIS